MRRLGLLVAAGLAVASSGAVAGPRTPDRTHDGWSHKVDSTSKIRLGVLVTSLTPELRDHFGAPTNRGLLVARVEPGSSAADAGIRVGDVIIEVHGKHVDEASDVAGALATTRRGDRVAVRLIRDRKPLAVHAEITDAALPDFAAWWRQLFTPFGDRTAQN